MLMGPEGEGDAWRSGVTQDGSWLQMGLSNWIHLLLCNSLPHCDGSPACFCFPRVGEDPVKASQELNFPLMGQFTMHHTEVIRDATIQS